MADAPVGSSGPSVAVVIPTRNRPDRLPALIAAVLNQTNPSVTELVVVDDASDPETTQVLRQLAGADRRITVIRRERQGGPAIARNQGWRATTADVVAFTDDDCMPQAGWLTNLVTATSDADIVQGRTAVDPQASWSGPFGRWIDVPAFSHYFETCNIAYRRAMLESLDGFDEAFGLSRGGAPNGEDIDLGWRAVEAGARCEFAADALVFHPAVPMSFPARVRSQLRSARMVYTVKRHPGLRDYLPRRFFTDIAHPPALVAAAGLVSTAWLPLVWGVPVTVVASIPYLRCRLGPRRVPGRHRDLPVTVPATFVIDLADIAVLAVASVRWRAVLL